MFWEYLSDDHAHLLTLIQRRRVRNLFMKTYWVACWKCDFLRGPYRTEELARAECNWGKKVIKELDEHEDPP